MYRKKLQTNINSQTISLVSNILKLLRKLTFPFKIEFWKLEFPVPALTSPPYWCSSFFSFLFSFFKTQIKNLEDTQNPKGSDICKSGWERVRIWSGEVQSQLISLAWSLRHCHHHCHRLKPLPLGSVWTLHRLGSIQTVALLLLLRFAGFCIISSLLGFASLILCSVASLLILRAFLCVVSFLNMRNKEIVSLRLEFKEIKSLRLDFSFLDSRC